MGIARETTGILQQGGYTLVLTHLVEHGALDIARDTDQALVGFHLDDIVVLQADVTGQATIEDVLIDIDYRHQTALTIDLDITQSSQIVGTTGHIQGMEHRGKSTQGIGTGGLDLTHHVDQDAAGVAQRQLQAAALIARTQGVAKFLLSGSHRKTTDLDRAIA